MNLNVYNEENKRRTNYAEVTDEHLIRWTGEIEDGLEGRARLYEDETEKTRILMPGSETDGFIQPVDFNRNFQKTTHGVLNYISWDNVVLAGGSVGNMINTGDYRNDYTQSDLDLFIYGLDEAGARQKIEHIVEQIRRYVADTSKCSLAVMHNQYVVTMIPYRSWDSKYVPKFKIQIILRLYKCIYEILAGFDVDSSAVAYNGHDVLLTARSLNAFQTRMNVFDLSRRSPSYEYRLYKYQRRGFGIYIPFDFQSQYNKLYFMNRRTKGIDKLLYLTKFQNKNSLARFLNMMTQRLNIKLKSKPMSDYESGEAGELEVDLSKAHDLQSYVVKYNHRVAEEFRYELEMHARDFQPAVANLKFMVHNPGQQLTGSFHPINDGEWLQPNYDKSGADFIGRRRLLLEIKNNQINDVTELYEQYVYDNSLFNPMEYLIMYSNNEEMCLLAWDNRHRMAPTKNLYGFDEDYLEMAVMMGRRLLVEHILAKSESRIGRDGLVNRAVNLAIFLDNLEIIKSIRKSQNFSMQDYRYRDAVVKYRSVEIAKYYGIEIPGEQSGIVDTLRKMQPGSPARIRYLFNRGDNAETAYVNQRILDGILDEIDYQELTIDELRIVCQYKNGGLKETLRQLCLKDVQRRVAIKDEENVYVDEESFEYAWYQNRLILARRTEERKSTTRDKFAREVLLQLFYTKKQLSEYIEIEFKDPVKAMSPLTLHLAKLTMSKDITNLKLYRNDYNLWDDDQEINQTLREIILLMDDLEVVKEVVSEKSLLKFLGKYNRQLGPQLRAYYDEAKKDQINLRTEAVYEKFAEVFRNTDEHVECLRSGALPEEYLRVENVFGQTPCDYLMNQVFYLRSQMEKYGLALTDERLKKLVMMRKSLVNIDRSQEVQFVVREACQDLRLQEILERI